VFSERKELFIYERTVARTFLIANVDAQALSASAQWRLAVSWSVDRCWTRVPRRRRTTRSGH